LLDFLKEPFLAIQEFYILAGAALRNVFRRPHYATDVFMQMDIIGVGSLPIVVLMGLFSGAVLALQMARALAHALNGPEPVVTGGFRLGDVRHITADSSRLRAELGWLPRIEFVDGMAELAAS